MPYANIEDRRASDRRYYKNHRAEIAAAHTRYRGEHLAEHRGYGAKWRKSHRSHLAATRRERRASSVEARIVDSLRSRLNDVLKKALQHKTRRALALLGCTPQELLTYLESQFSEGMSWGNYGPKGWHIDHKRPCASFDLADPEQQALCFHYTNLQPLWAVDNLSKGGWKP